MKPRIISTFAAMALLCSSAHAVTTSINSGSLGAAGNGTNADAVTLGVAGPLAAAGDTAAGYSGGSNTTVPFNEALNPSSTSPFTIEFWANPATDVTDGSGPSPVFNRVSSGNRSGWVFFQRSAAQGWNFGMYNGSGSTVGRSITGGTYTPGAWTHVVAVWDGATPSLYVDGVNTNAAISGPGGYNASGTAIFSVGAYDTGSNPFNGAVDETAFYSAALSPTQILAHYNAAASTTPGAYSNLVVADGAVLYLNNVPEPTSAVLMLLGLAGVMRRRRN
jgi:hypothetical protein